MGNSTFIDLGESIVSILLETPKETEDNLAHFLMR